MRTFVLSDGYSWLLIWKHGTCGWKTWGQRESLDIMEIHALKADQFSVLQPNMVAVYCFSSQLSAHSLSFPRPLVGI
jgi:hypothetical protein